MSYYTRLRIHEVFEKFETLKTREEKISWLKQNESAALLDMLRCVFDDRIKFLLPEGTPPYNPADESSVPSNLMRQHLKLTYFVKGGKGDQIVPFKRERIFLDVLESIHPKDALVLLSAKDKKPPVKGLTKKLVQETFPGLVP